MSSSVDLLEYARTVKGPGPDVGAIIQGTPREVPANVTRGALAAVAVGIAALLLGLSTEKERTLGVVLTCLVYFMGVSQGAVMFAVAQTITLGRWGRPFKRVAEAMWAWMPINYALWLVFLAVGGMDLYEWTHEPMHGHKATYLQPGFFYARQLFGLGFLLVLDFVFIRRSLRPDLGVAGAKLGSKAPAWWGRLTAGWQGAEAEIEATYKGNVKLAPVIVVTYAIVYTVFAVDAVMSLAPHWYANMFPAWHFVSSFWLALNWICILSVHSRGWLGTTHLMTPTNYHDLGKLIFALCIFWTYNLFAQILPIWYGNMPEETGYLLLRMYAEPWNALAKVVGAGCFLFPFFVLLSRGIKKTPGSLVWVSTWIAFAIFLERFLMVMPQVWKRETLPLGLVELGVFAGFVGAFVFTWTRAISQVPPVPVSDPFMNPNPNDVHVHAPHAAHAGGGH